METFPWEVGEAAQPPASSLPVTWSTETVVVAAGRSEMHTICSPEEDDDDVARIGGGYGWWATEGDARRPDLNFPLDLGLTDITKYSSYSKLWRMLYFINDAPFCIREAMAKTGTY